MRVKQMGQVAVILRVERIQAVMMRLMVATPVGQVEAVTRVASAMTIPMAMVCPMIATLNLQ